MSFLAKIGLRSKLKESINGQTSQMWLRSRITLLQTQQADRLVALQENRMFSDGSWSLQVRIDIDPDAKPVHVQPYPMPCIHLSTLKKELDYLKHLGVLQPQQENHSFIIPKKDVRVSWIRLQ